MTSVEKYSESKYLHGCFPLLPLAFFTNYALKSCCKVAELFYRIDELIVAVCTLTWSSVQVHRWHWRVSGTNTRVAPRPEALIGGLLPTVDKDPQVKTSCSWLIKEPLTCLDEIWYVVKTHWKLHKITLKVVYIPFLGRKSLPSCKFVSEIHPFRLWRHSSLRAYYNWQLQCALKATVIREQPYRSWRGMPYRCVAGGCSRTSDDGVLIHKFPTDASLASKWSKRYAYIAQIGQIRLPPPDFAACISPVTATTGKQLCGRRCTWKI